MLVAWGGIACGGDATRVTVGVATIGEDSGADSGTTLTAASSSTTGHADTSGTSGNADSSGTGDSGTTGEPLAPGQSQAQLVGAGQSMSSASYRMVFTLGQPSQLRSIQQSGSYRLNGGLVGANGSPP